ncbi:MAG: hypothetical protein ABSE82_02365 [Nitrososphaerales archaeon]|jgi:hypothetical protein
MIQITDEYMNDMLKTTRPYTVVILRATTKRNEPGADQIVWEHGRRNFVLRRDGRLCIVCPATDEGNVSGLYIFNTDVDETRKIMDEDPAVRSGIFRYDIHSVRSFPGDSLAK